VKTFSCAVAARAALPAATARTPVQHAVAARPERFYQVNVQTHLPMWGAKKKTKNVMPECQYRRAASNGERETGGYYDTCLT
jgi:hypothetical protein